MRLATEAGIQNPNAFSSQYLLLIRGASLMATIEQSSDGATEQHLLRIHFRYRSMPV